MAHQKDKVKAVAHIVHEYANFVSSAEMKISGRDLKDWLNPPVNTHVSHAFYLNCRKMADFFQNKGDDDNIKAEDFVPGFCASLPESFEWRDPINKHLAHISYTRDKKPREIGEDASEALYKELQGAWHRFRSELRGGAFQTEFENQIRRRKSPDNGTPSEFASYNLD